jgi:MFS family permease
MKAFPILGTRNGKLYYSGHAVSQTGTWMNTTALAWLVLDLTDSGAAVGVAASLLALPVLFIGPFAGVLVDRAAALRMLVIVQSTMAVTGVLLALLAVTGAIETWHVFVLSLAFGVGRCFEIPARQALLAEMAGREHLRMAITLQATVNNGARIVGPSLAGLLIAGVGTWFCFVLNAASYIVILGLFLTLDRRQFTARPLSEPGTNRLRDGLRHVTRDRVAAPVLAISLMSGLVLQQYPTVLPILAKWSFDGSAQSFGLLMSGLGVGALVGGPLVASRGRTGVGPVAAACVGVSLAYAVVAVMPTLELAAVGMVAMGCANIALLSTANSTIQLSGGADMQGRLVSLYAASNVGASALGAPVIGALCDAAGPRGTLGAAAAVGATVGILGLRVARSSPGSSES